MKRYFEKKEKNTPKVAPEGLECRPKIIDIVGSGGP